MKFYQELTAVLDDEPDRFRWPTTWNGNPREMLVHHVFVYLYSDGEFDRAQISGTLILLNGNLSVSDEGRWVSAHFHTYDELPKQVRDALEERKARGR